MNLFSLTVLFPFLGFLLLAFSRDCYSKSLITLVGVGSIGLSALITLWVVLDFFNSYNNATIIYTQTFWHWIKIGDFHIPMTFRLDPLSLIMLVVINCVGFFINLYASWYMREESGYARFFAYINLFFTSMLILVLADNMLLMYLGWEGVGLCSYLLIGFYYTDSRSGIAAIKAFITTRIGDVLLGCSLFIFYHELGTLNFHDLIMLAPQKLEEGSTAIIWAILMLLGGAIGKSAQFPLHTWLPDAMAGPTPASALIHAATMITAGVYLIARSYGLFLMIPWILNIVGFIGALTLILAASAALVQNNIKRVLAYSTMSQVGYMFLALGAEAMNAAIFHLITHAFFKALLFLSSGSVILACHNEQNIFKMGGLYKSMPLIYICFLVGGAALSALPLVTAGFYSKEAIFWNALVNGHEKLVIIGLIGALLTAVYMFRLIFIISHGETNIKVKMCSGVNHYLPLLFFLVFSTFIAVWIISPFIQTLQISNFDHDSKYMLEIISSAIPIIGIFLAATFWLGQRRLVNTIVTSIPGNFLKILCFHAWGFDWLYNKIFVKPYLAIANLLIRDPFSTIINCLSLLVRQVERSLAPSENGKLRWYALSMVFGALILLMLLLLFKNNNFMFFI